MAVAKALGAEVAACCDFLVVAVAAVAVAVAVDDGPAVATAVPYDPDCSVPYLPEGSS